MRPKLYVTEPKSDHRGWFVETFNRDTFKRDIGLAIDWVQDCRFRSMKGALRGPHFYPVGFNQYKLVECIAGRIFDVAVCVDERSPDYKQCFGITLEEGDNRHFLVPPGYAHGVLALEDSIVEYKTNVGNQASAQGALAWDDPALNIMWPIEPTIFSGEKTKPLAEHVYWRAP
jgi:dTDP-4-dehydrorhamnose 3,5-epimerase